MTSPDMYALMVTGKSEGRIRWARHQISQYMEHQQYDGRKFLLVANEHANLNFQHESELYVDRVKEIHIQDRSTTSLGKIRNRLLDVVPSGSYVFVLDDDDYVSSSLITEMIRYWRVQSGRTAMVQLGNRLNHNIVTDSSWQSSHPSGFVHFVGDIDLLRKYNFRYLPRDSLEDLSIHELDSRTIWHDSAPELYIRYVHGENTSLYVNSRQTEANTSLGENVVDAATSEFCRKHAPSSRQQQRCRWGFSATFVLLLVAVVIAITALSRSIRP